MTVPAYLDCPDVLLAEPLQGLDDLVVGAAQLQHSDTHIHT